MLILLASLAAASASIDVCHTHTSQSECHAFRLQHECVWDMPSQQCVADEPCTARSAERCTFELTTGRNATWDQTLNRCFWDTASSACRWSDECLAAKNASACGAGNCEWRRACTPADERFYPGPHVCSHLCVPPSWPTLHADVPRSPSSLKARPAVSATATAGGGTASSTSTSTPVVDLPAGQVQGVRSGGIDMYLGLPFANAPVAGLRWSPPQPLATWNGVYDASSSAARCPTSLTYSLATGGGSGSRSAGACRSFTRGVCAGYSEDCLSLSVYTPNTPAAGSAGSGSRPVLFWIHGGCFVSGSSSDYDGAALAREQDVVVVIANYRLGAMGFLAHDALRDRDSEFGSTGNYGLQDNVAALEWVQANIAALGGDPGRVTIFGESSGAGSVSQLLGVKRAWPFFHQAIMESGGAAFWTYMNMHAAYDNFNKVVTGTKCSGQKTIEDKIACLEQAPYSSVTTAVSSVYCRDGCSWTPVVDGVTVVGRTKHLGDVGGLRPDTPIMAGHNLNDGAMFVPYDFQMSRADRSEYFAKRFGPNRRKALETLYPVPAKSTTPATSTSFMSAQACETDFSYACDNQFLASGAQRSGKAYLYEFSALDSYGLSLHGDEIAYVFGTGAAAGSYVSNITMAYWANFARSGDPNGDGLPTWPAWDDGSAMLNISDSTTVARKPYNAQCNFFREHWDYYKVCLPTNPDIAV